MKVLHIAAHLGGGVGKAHAALCASSDERIERHYYLLESPRDRRFADEIAASGAQITVEPDAASLRQAASAADLVQIEWWNHPRLYAALCGTNLPPVRSLVWCHISGLFAPFVPAQLIGAVDRFVFTSPCSKAQPAVHALPEEQARRLAVIGSGFGFAGVPGEPAASRHPSAVTSLGTLDFAKMSPAFFEVVDRLDHAVTVTLWGSVEAKGPVRAAARAMRHPERILFMGHSADPAASLSGAGIFLYLLQPEHYGTGENGLVEAMSLGLVPLAFDNPAERCIIEDGVTGWLARGPEDAARRLDWMLDHPAELSAMGARAMQAAARQTPSASAAAFAALYRDLMRQERRSIDFREILGKTGADWFLSTQLRERPGAGSARAHLSRFPAEGAEAKGSLAHFRAALPDDPSLRF
ncbi:glycosyltransferase [Rhizobium sp. YIM 134829]|uniref:glycosyltransferase n=1 Tax=Rhizobium sp. YIM 134829 TaxID=3390453 RepID=UPI00397C15DA